MAKKVFLGVGHGGNDSGAVGYLVEKDVNLTMALANRDYLVANGVQVKMSRTKDENDPLNEEIRECNAYNPDLAVDHHNNAGGGDGFEAIHSKGSKVGEQLARNIEEEVKKLGQNSRGVKTRLNSSRRDYFGFVRETDCPAVICEGVFVDNATDVKIADTLAEQRAFGEAYARGILKTLNVTSANKPPKPSDGNHADGKLVVDGKWGKDCTRKSQKVYGTTEDGIVSNQPLANQEYLYSCYTVSWQFKSSGYKAGSSLIKAIQKDLKSKDYYTGNVDGWCGEKTVIAIQKFLRDKGFYKGAIDGSMGPATVKAWQQYINSRL